VREAAEPTGLGRAAGKAGACVGSGRLRLGWSHPPPTHTGAAELLAGGQTSQRQQGAVAGLLLVLTGAGLGSRLWEVAEGPAGKCLWVVGDGVCSCRAGPAWCCSSLSVSAKRAQAWEPSCRRGEAKESTRAGNAGAVEMQQAGGGAGMQRAVRAAFPQHLLLLAPPSPAHHPPNRPIHPARCCCCVDGMRLRSAVDRSGKGWC
jgi:hypothetical protein